MTMKHYKLIVHERSFSAEDLIINPRDCPSLKKGDIVEIYHPEDEFSRLLLQVTIFKEDLQGKETISVESSIASAFQLRKYVDVCMQLVEPETVSLDSVELTFKDQYMGRSEMWRLKNSLINTCIYLNKKIEFCGGYIRCQVYEMWSSGVRVACGVITENTKIVFRSSTSMVYLFLQMSSEMWDFDIHGDLYFEKAVNGFLADLFQKWKKHGSNHEVTIVLFSRTFYKASSLEEFPRHMRDCLQQDYRGRFYEDFYRVAVQNERYDDWSSTLVQLRRLFMDYQRLVLEYHKRPGIEIPKAVNSTAAQGNFLEVLNMSLNVFEKHYLDRSFERTGQLSVVITPGVGVFEVDRQLTNITKQRIIDNGVGSDLVCVGEQPLHAVPLLKFHNKDTSISAVDDYSMPHWINLSFYSTNKKVAYSNFVPRIKLPPRTKSVRTRSHSSQSQCAPGEVAALPTTPTTPKTKLVDEEFFPESPFDYDAYDRQVFQMPTVHTTRFSRQLQRASSRHKKGSVTLDGGVSVSITGPGMQHLPKSIRRKISDPDIHHMNNGENVIVGSPSNGHSHLMTSPKMISGGPNVGPASPLSTLMGSSPILGSSLTPRSAAISIPQIRSNNNSPQPSLSVNANEDGFAEMAKVKHRALEDLLEGETSPPLRVVAGSMGSPTSPISPTSPPQNTALLRPGRALINPFDPSHVTIKLTSNRRRWTHIFPKGPEGVLIQQHHYQAVPTFTSNEDQSQSQTTAQMQGTNGQSQEVVSVRSTSPIGDLALKFNSRSGMTRSASQIAFQDHVRGRSLGRPQLSERGQIPTQIVQSANKALLWGATGEQEWTPALTTVGKIIIGVDWKSLTISACLPITTDYFPDKRSLQNDYVVSDYYLLPDDVNADFAQRRAIYKKPLTTSEVFKELVSQRLAQGFQLIVPNKDGAPFGSLGAGVKIETPATPSSVVGPRTTDMEPSEEYLLSIGRIFHRISLKGSCITVTRYRPRHPYPPFNFYYQYRFQAPDHESYEVSWVSFTTEKLENFNWNYVDHYICTRGDTDFALAEALKYWRFRVYLLPVNQSATRKILDGSEHCDIYVPPSTEDQCQMVKNFLRFIETFVNRIRRPNAHKKPRDPHSFQPAPLPLQLSHLTRRRHSTSLTFLSHSSSSANHATNISQDKHLPSGRLVERFYARSGSKVLERGRASPAGEGPVDFTSNNDHQDWLEDGLAQPELRLGRNASTSDIVDAMRQPMTGVGFLAHHTSSLTFASADAVQWLIKHVEDVTCQQSAEKILEKMLSEKLICHASGDHTQPLKIGFYLYHIVSDHDHQKDGDSSSALFGDIQSFENEWLEVEVRHPTNWMPPASGGVDNVPNSPTLQQTPITIPLPPLPKFLQDKMEEMCQGDGVAQYKNIHLEIDVNNKSDRIEWGHCRYQSLFRPDRAYELVVQWLSASGPIVAELIVSGWARKAIQCSLQMVPIPADPLALPFTHKSDPLRGPVFVPLDTECLMGSKSYLFQEFPEDSWAQRLLLFQETIALRFGFIACAMENRGTSPQANRFNREKEKEQTRHHHQYVHITGNMFLLIPSPPCHRSHAQDMDCQGKSKRTVGRQPSVQYPTHHDVMVSSPHEEYITRHVSGNSNQDEYGPDRKIGFLWSWNHMLTRRWRGPNSATGDEQFQNKMLKDFREFCSNQNNRLLNFWDQCWIIRDQYEERTSSASASFGDAHVPNGEGVRNGNFNNTSVFCGVHSTLEEVPEKV
ncbi:GATOR complex protein Iml1 isoform X3 [Frankliniella occidentalis]|uniref:GATOR complex protein Iml1 isoform X3 n=1 Tax=Frankliniella occidentalis TaxID=133901 RepID=A0A6J1SAC1_FRAOC|nr:GATOR complex protein Iml1 isoform X3 [Frankliniella occidentalis]